MSYNAHAFQPSERGSPHLISTQNTAPHDYISNGLPASRKVVVFALHDFNAEEPDEISFAAGEPIEVIEKDEAFGDGWWRGRNVRGQSGLFPMNYITQTAPTNRSTPSEVQQPRSPPPAAPVSDTSQRQLLEPQRLKTTSLSPSVASLTSPTASSPWSTLSASVRDSTGPPRKDFETYHPNTWTPFEVEIWIEEAGHKSYAPLFSKNRVLGADLLTISLTQLRDLGMGDLTERIELLNEIIALKDRWDGRTPTIDRVHRMEDTFGPPPNSTVEKERKRRHTGGVPSQDSGFAEEKDDVAVVEKEEELNRTMAYFTLSDLYAEDDENIGDDEIVNDDEIEYEEDSETTLHRPSGSSGFRSMQYRDSKTSSRQSALDRLDEIARMASDLASEESKMPTGGMIGQPWGYSGRGDSRSGPSSPVSPPAPTGFQVAVGEANDQEGWLELRVNGDMLWKRRWCVLRSAELFIYKAQGQPKPLHVIPLAQGYRILPGMDSTSGAKRDFVFTARRVPNTEAGVFAGTGRSRPVGHVFHFAVGNQLSMVTWINLLVRASQQVSRFKPVPLIPIKSNYRNQTTRVPMSSSVSVASTRIFPVGASPMLSSANLPGISSPSPGNSFLPPAKFYPSTMGREPSLHRNGTIGRQGSGGYPGPF
ncbi:hypothetical protein BJ742DRAFT_407933 [Cladochytrium replicatum]|nr:hypothetical protein BJ742DRAFT_407933 [Cladochytrium replicatum]